jgi:hypothetical protein
MPNDSYDHARRLAAAAVAYLHACGCATGRRDAAGERLVLEAFVTAAGAVIRQPTDTEEETRWPP